MKSRKSACKGGELTDFHRHELLLSIIKWHSIPIYSDSTPIDYKVVEDDGENKRIEIYSYSTGELLEIRHYKNEKCVSIERIKTKLEED